MNTSKVNELSEIAAWRTFLSRLPEPALLVEGHGYILAVNTPLAVLLRRPALELQDRELTEIVTTPAEQVLSYVAHCARTAGLLLGALTVRPAEGPPLDCHCEGAVLQPWSPAAPAIIFLRLKLRQSAANQFLLLNRKIAALSQALRERQHQQTLTRRLLEDAQRANADLQHFAYMVSHDLNEPLRTLQSFVELLARRMHGNLESEAAEDLAFITDAAQRMQQMLSDLLAYTKAGEQPTFQAVECEALLTHVLEMLHVRIVECGAVITHDPLPTVYGDATRLGQVFQNLLSNALKFCETHPPRIHITAGQDGGHWRFAVRDNGIGLDPQHATRIFQVFQRLHTRNAYPGTGIGLAICKRIIEQHGGRIWVESAPGTGATFFFTLPAALHAATDHSSPT